MAHCHQATPHFSIYDATGHAFDAEASCFCMDKDEFTMLLMTAMRYAEKADSRDDEAACHFSVRDAKALKNTQARRARRHAVRIHAILAGRRAPPHD